MFEECGQLIPLEKPGCLADEIDCFVDQIEKKKIDDRPIYSERWERGLVINKLKVLIPYTSTSREHVD